MAHDDVLEAVVVAVPHPKWQERPLAIVVPVEGGVLTRDDIVGCLLGQFAKWQMPDAVLFVEALPRTSVGKIRKFLLRDPAGGEEGMR